MISVAIVDDEKVERERIRAALDFVAKKKEVYFNIEEFASAETFLIKYNYNFDLIFMDVMFGKEQNGMDAARELRKMDTEVGIVFVTNMAQMAIAGYEVEALDYVLKPVEERAFLLKMDRIIARIGKRSEEFISVNCEREVIRLRARLIRYLVVDDHYVEYHSPEGVFAEYITLSAAEKKLGSDNFCRCDRGCLVNLRYVSQITKDSCIVDGEELTIARQRRAEFRQAFADYLCGMRG